MKKYISKSNFYIKLLKLYNIDYIINIFDIIDFIETISKYNLSVEAYDTATNIIELLTDDDGSVNSIDKTDQLNTYINIWNNFYPQFKYNIIKKLIITFKGDVFAIYTDETEINENIIGSDIKRLSDNNLIDVKDGVYGIDDTPSKIVVVNSKIVDVINEQPGMRVAFYTSLDNKKIIIIKDINGDVIVVDEYVNGTKQPLQLQDGDYILLGMDKSQRERNVYHLIINNNKVEDIKPFNDDPLNGDVDIFTILDETYIIYDYDRESNPSDVIGKRISELDKPILGTQTLFILLNYIKLQIDVENGIIKNVILTYNLTDGDVVIYDGTYDENDKINSTYVTDNVIDKPNGTYLTYNTTNRDWLYITITNNTITYIEEEVAYQTIYNNGGYEFFVFSEKSDENLWIDSYIVNNNAITDRITETLDFSADGFNLVVVDNIIKEVTI